MTKVADHIKMHFHIVDKFKFVRVPVKLDTKKEKWHCQWILSPI